MSNCRANCIYWEQLFYQEKDEDENEKFYDYCNLKHHAVKHRDCYLCEEYEYGCG